MVWLILGLNVTKDVDVSLRDTVLSQVLWAMNISFGAAGEYSAGVQTSIYPVSVYNGTVLNSPYLRLINPASGIGINGNVYPDISSLEHLAVKIYDISSGGNLISIADIPAPASNYSIFMYEFTNCGDRICSIVIFGDFSAGDWYVNAYVIEPSGTYSQVFEYNTSNSITRMDIFGNLNILPDTVVIVFEESGNVHLHAVDINLPSSSNPVISHTITGGTHYTVNGAFFQDGGSRLFSLTLFDMNTYNATFVGFDLNSGTVFSNTQHYNVLLSSNNTAFNSRGFCVVSDDGVNLFVYLYDVFSGNFYGDTLTSVGPINGVFPTGYPDICSFMTGFDLYAIDVDNRSLTGTIALPTGIFNVANPFFDENTIAGSEVHIAGINMDAMPYDTLFYLTYNVDYSGIALQSIDTVAMNIPTAPQFSQPVVHGGNLYLSKSIPGHPMRIVKTELDYTFHWEGDTISGNNYVYTPLYVLDIVAQQMRILDEATGAALSYAYDIPFSTYGGVQYMKLSGSNLYLLTGDYSTSLHLHQINASDLTGSATDLGITISYGYYDFRNDTIAIAYTDFNDQNVKLYLYDIISSTLSSPQSFDIDATTESAGRVALKGGYVYLPVSTLSTLRFFRCTTDFATCIDVDIDKNTYGNLIDYMVDDNGYVYMSTFTGNSSYIFELDENLNINSIAGPIPGLIYEVNGAGEYLVLIRSSSYSPVDTSFVMFSRKSNLSLIDFADTLAGTYGVSSLIYEYSPGQYYAFFTALERDIALARLVRYNITDATGTEEISDSRFLYQVRNGRLILQGKGDVNVRIFDITGRMVGSFNGSIDGQKTIARFPAQGIYLLDINGSKFKVVNINR